MTSSTDDFQLQVQRLKAELVAQGVRVQALVSASMDAVFLRDQDAAKAAIALDEQIDRADVELEKACVELLTRATGLGAQLEAGQLRWVLMIVKVNNELERTADVGVTIAETCAVFAAQGQPLPSTFRVLANSALGILRDSVAALDRLDPELARVVLLSEETVLRFKQALVRDVAQQVSQGRMTVDLAGGLHDVAMQCVNIADHCTNIAEQVMYTATGKIVRHMQGHWEEVHFTK
jgi:phosphate transport system protein